MEVHNLRQEIINLKRLLLQHKDCPVTKASKGGKMDPSLLPPPIVCKYTLLTLSDHYLCKRFLYPSVVVYLDLFSHSVGTLGRGPEDIFVILDI